MSASFRVRSVSVTSAQYEALSALALAGGHDSPDAALEALLTPVLAQHAHLAWLIEQTRERKKLLRAEYHEKVGSEGSPDWPSPAALAKRDLRGEVA